MPDSTPLQLQDGWPVTSLENSHFDANCISELTRWIEETYQYQNTHAVLIEHAGSLVYELYLNGPDERWGYPLGHRVFDVNSLHDLRSISKSVTSLLLGLALNGNYQHALATPITDYFKTHDITFASGAEKITLQHVLTMTAGLEWDEWSLPYSDPLNDEHQLNITDNPIALVLERQIKHTAGSVWAYSGGLTQVLAAIVEEITGRQIHDFAAESLFESLGITRFEWLGSPLWKPSGMPSAASGLRMRARDLAKIGSLILHDGIWNGNQIVPSEWIQLSTQRHVARVGGLTRGVYGYGYQWWPGHSRSIPSYEIIAGFGNGGQQLLIIPEHQLVVTIFAGNYGRNGQNQFNWMLGRIVPTHQRHR